jgi:hypothetical protein
VNEEMETGANLRLDSVRVLVEEMIVSMVNVHQRQEACVHLYGVSNFARFTSRLLFL